MNLLMLNRFYIFSSAILMLFVMVFSPDRTFSQEIEPRNYSSVPAGMNVIALSYSYSSGDIVTDAAAPIKDLQLNSSNLGLGYLRSFGLAGNLCKIQVAVPFAFLAGTAKLRGKDTAASRTGFADARIKFLMNLFGTPALEPKDFVKFKEEFVFGTSLTVSVPTGQYFNEKLINLGSNRWGFKPEIGASYNKGPFYFEVFTGVWFFTKNSEYLKTNTSQQNPLFSIQGHLSYLFPSKIWIALNSVYVTGGDTKLNGNFQNDLQNNFRSGVTVSFPINIHHSVKANFSAGVATKAGGDFNIYSITYQYIWF